MKITQHRLLLLALCGALFVPFPAAAQVLAKLQRIRIIPGTDRATLFLSRPVRYRYFTLSKPPRLVLDLRDTAPTHPSNAALHSARVAAVHFGVHRGHELRVVFDLHGKTQGARVREVRAGARDRLEVRFSPTGRSKSRSARAQAAAAGAPSTSADQATDYQAVPRTGPMIVEIDPGHGGSDPGTTGPHGLHEKTVTLAIGRMVYRMLNHTPGVRAYLTRDGDYYVSLYRRVLEAQAHHADIYVSIHENSYPYNPEVRGGTCYVLSRHGASDAEAAQLAREENAADPQIAGVSFSHHSRILNRVLTDLYQTSSIIAGDQLAHDIISQFAAVEPVYHRTVQHANFEVLRDPMIPSVLCETAFLSNPTQARELHHWAFRHKLARAIYLGILRYVHAHVPMEVAQARERPYVVQRGDTLSGIAERFRVSTRQLQTFNGLPGTVIHAGETLRIPSSGSS